MSVCQNVSQSKGVCQKISQATSVKRLGLLRRPAVWARLEIVNDEAMVRVERVRSVCSVITVRHCTHFTHTVHTA